MTPLQLKPFNPDFAQEPSDQAAPALKPFSPFGGEEDKGELKMVPFEPTFAPGTISTSSVVPPAFGSTISASPVEEKPSDIAGAVGRGIMTSFNPFGTDEKEYAKKRTTGEAIAEGAANIVTDIASTVAASSLAGAAMGGGVPGAAVGTAVGVGLGIYRALGYEDLMSRVDARPFSPTKAAVNVAVEVLPALRLGGKIAQGFSQGTLSAIQSLQYGADIGTAATVGAVGGGVAGLAAKAKVKEKQATALTALSAEAPYTPRQLDWMHEALLEGDNSKRILDRTAEMAQADETGNALLRDLGSKQDLFAAISSPKQSNALAAQFTPDDFGIPAEVVEGYRKIYGDAAEVMAVRGHIESQVQAVARNLLNLPADVKVRPDKLAEAAQQLRSEGTDWDAILSMTQAKKYQDRAIAEVNDELAETGEVLRDPTFTKNPILSKIADPIYVGRAVDHTTGLNLEGATNNISFSHNLHSKLQWSYNQKIHNLRAAAKKEGILEDFADYLDGSKSIDQLSPKGMRIVNGMRELLDDAYAYGKKHGIDIDYKKDYFPSQKMDTADAVRAFRNRAKELGREAFEDTEEGREFRSALSDASGIEVETFADFRRAMTNIEESGKLKTSTGYTASAAFKREDKIPYWLQDRDVGKVAQRYVSNITKAVHMAPAIRKLETQVHALDGLGMHKSAEYYRRYINRLSGQPSDFLAYVDAKKNQLKISLDKIIDDPTYTKLQKSSAQFAKRVPDFLSWAGAQIYPNYLGLSPKAFIRNLTQSQFLTAPEVGGVYGHKAVAKATLGTIKDGMQLTNMEKFLVDAGYAPGKYVGEGLDIVHNSLRSSVIGPVVGGIEKLSEFSMKLYGWSDTINRYITVKASRAVFSDIRSALLKRGQDLTSNEKGAVQALRRLNPGVRGEVRRLLQQGQFEAAQEEFTRFLLSKSQFNYGPQALHQFGQDFGRMFSMFTKWPSMLVSDLTEMFQRRQTKEFMFKHIGPLALLAGLQQWLDMEDASPRTKALVGASLISWAPVSAIKVSAPPWLSTAAEGIKFGFDALGGDLDSMEKVLKRTNRLMEPYVPGGVIPQTLQRARNIFQNKE